MPPTPRTTETLQDTFLAQIRDERTTVSLFLTNGIRLVGEVTAFDAYVVTLKSQVTQMVYKHTIATIVPSTAIPPRLTRAPG